MKKKLLFSVFGLFLTIMSFAQVKPTKGTGSTNDPFQIENLNHLRWISEGPDEDENDRFKSSFILTADIDASDTKNWNDGKGFRPIEELAQDLYYEYTTVYFDGQGHVISNLTINRPNEQNVGLFKVLNGSLRNLGLENISIIGGNNTGAFAGVNYSYIAQIYVTGTIEGKENVGGLVGINYRYIKLSFVNADIIGDNTVGGLMGLIGEFGTIAESYAACAIECPDNKGGIVGDVLLNPYNDPFYELPGPDYPINIFDCYYDSDKLINNGYSNHFEWYHRLETTNFNKQYLFNHWNFQDIWTIDIRPEIDSNPRPYLNFNLNLNEIYSQVTLSHYPQDIEVDVYGYYENSIFYPWGAYLTEYRKVIQFSAKNSDEYYFKKWTVDAYEQSRDPNFIFSIQTHTEVTAHYEKYTDFFAGGTGTKEAPYQISTYEQLQFLGYHSEVLDKHFILINDIDAIDSKDFYKLDFLTTGKSQEEPFTGGFNGQGFTIKNLSFDDYNTNTGLFGVVDIKDNSIQNIKLENLDFDGRENVGGLVGEMISGTLYRCIVSGRIKNSFDNNTGGLVGLLTSGTINECVSKVSIYGSDNTGGLVGFNKNGAIIKSFSFNTVNDFWSNSEKFGGLVGKNQGTIQQSYAVGNINGTNTIGGLIGKNNGGTTTDSYWDKETSSQQTSSGSDDQYGKTIEEFALTQTFQNWDFENDWEIRLATEYDTVPRPYLKWMFEDYTSYQVELTVNNSEFGTVAGAGAYLLNQKAILKAQPNKDHEFVHWLQNGQVFSTEDSLQHNITEDLTLEAVFVQIGFPIDTEFNNKEGDVAIIQTVLETGTETTISIEAKEGYIVSVVSINGIDITEGMTQNGNVWEYKSLSLGSGSVLKIEFTEDKSLNVTNIKINTITFHPNPIKSSFTLQNVQNGTIIKLNSSLGNTVLETTYNGKPISSSHLSPGVYTLILQDENGTKTEKLIKE